MRVEPTCVCAGVYSGRKLASSSLSACGSDLLASQADLSWSTKSTPLLPRGWANEPCDFWVQRWSNYFYILGKLLVKFFTRTQSCEFDLDVFLRPHSVSAIILSARSAIRTGVRVSSRKTSGLVKESRISAVIKVCRCRLHCCWQDSDRSLRPANSP